MSYAQKKNIQNRACTCRFKLMSSLLEVYDLPILASISLLHVKLAQNAYPTFQVQGTCIYQQMPANVSECKLLLGQRMQVYG